jgi:adenine-specific DNA methylase
MNSGRHATVSKKIAINLINKNGKLDVRLVGDGHSPWPKEFDAENGTVSLAIATCPICYSVIDANTTRRLFKEKKSGQKMMAVVLSKPGQSGKAYRAATKEDEEVYNKAKSVLLEKINFLLPEWGINPIPDEPLPYWEIDGKIIYGAGIRLLSYGFYQ